MAKKKTLGQRFRDLGFSSYSAYLRSDHWQKMRKRYFRSSRPQYCWCCGTSKGPFQLHHKTYKRLGKERLTDLILLCEDCHLELHYRVKEDDNVFLFTGASILRAENIRAGVYQADTKLDKRSWNGVTTRFVDPENLRVKD